MSYTFKTVAMMSAHRYVRRLPASLPSVCDIISLLYALQFLIHSTFVFVIKDA